MFKKSFIKKLTNWEYWPSAMFYIPNLPYAFYLAIRAKNPVFFSATNPSIKNSGNGTESKFDVLQLIPEKYCPKSILVLPQTNFDTVLNEIAQKEISFPLIVKPDIGFRGLLVKKINSTSELKEYLHSYPINIIIQEFLDFKNECGIFYHRNPTKEKGWISSLTLKRFLTVTGNGTNTLLQLILNDERAKLYADILKDIHKNKLTTIPKNKEVVKLSVIGNHSKGTQFINGNHLITKQLEETFDLVNKSIKGWYYGRVDIKYNSFEELQQGKNFKILEINGIISEPTHIYDSKNYTYFKALKAIRTHWKSLFEIATTNHKQKNIPYKVTTEFINEVFQLKNYIKKIKRLH